MKKIFIIDDDSSINEILIDMLMGADYSAKAFTKGSEAVDVAKKEKPDLVLLDYFLSDEDPRDVVTGLRKNLGNKLPIILISASTQAKEMGEKMSVNEFIAKPFQRSALLSAISRNIH